MNKSHSIILASRPQWKARLKQLPLALFYILIGSVFFTTTWDTGQELLAITHWKNILRFCITLSLSFFLPIGFWHFYGATLAKPIKHQGTGATIHFRKGKRGTPDSWELHMNHRVWDITGFHPTKIPEHAHLEVVYLKGGTVLKIIQRKRPSPKSPLPNH